MCRFTNSPPLYSLYILDIPITWQVLYGLQCILIPVRTHFLSLLPVNGLVSKCMHQNYIHQTRCASTSHQTFSSTWLALKRTKCSLLTNFVHFSKFIFLCNPKCSTMILSLWLLLTRWHFRLLKLWAQPLDGSIFCCVGFFFFFLMYLMYCWARQT